MRVLGVDSGLRSFGWVIAEYEPGVIHPRFLKGGVLHTEPDRSLRVGADTSRRAMYLYREMRQILDANPVNLIAVEALAFPASRVQWSVISQLGRARGLVDALGVELNVAVVEATTQELKAIVPRAVGKVSKEQVQEAVKDIGDLGFNTLLLALKKSDREHFADACAAVLACERLHRRAYWPTFWNLPFDESGSAT